MASEQYHRAPDLVDDPRTPLDEFLVFACLRYGEDDTPDRWLRAARVLAEHPELTRSSIHAAAAAADVDALHALLGDDPALGQAEGGPYAWEPLLYLAYARHDPKVSESATLESARLLLEHGADPNAGYQWHGNAPPFTALTGAFGNGEGNQPVHPHGLALARLLLKAGADPNDGQALYNRQFGDDDSHLTLLFEYGLGHGDGGPWKDRLGDAIDSPSQLVRTQLWSAIVHDRRHRVELLAEHGADLESPYEVPGGRPSFLVTSDQRSPVDVAALCGSKAVLDWFTARGTSPHLSGVDALIAALLAGDRATVERLRDHVPEARTERPGLMVWAAARQASAAIPLLIAEGFDVNAYGRGDIPTEQPWQTALHEAACRGDLNLARLLVGFGADPDLRDARFDSTPLGWAQHFDHEGMVDYLRPLTAGS